MAKTRRNGEGSIRKRGDSCWEVRISGGIDFKTGKPFRVCRYAPTEADAVNLLHQLSFQFNSTQTQFSRMTLGEWLDLWLQVYARNTLKQSTFNSYDSYAKNHFKPALGGILLEDLTSRMLQNFYNYKYNEEHLAPKTIRNLNLYLHKALSQAQKEGLILTNPATGVTLPKATRPKVEILTRDEQARLTQASYQHRYGVFIRLVLMTGLRMGELLGLRWEDIDFRSNLLHVRRSLNRLQKMDTPASGEAHTEIVIQTPKTANSMRSIPLLPFTCNDLMAWKRVQEADRSAHPEQYVVSGFLVTNPLGGYIEPRTFSDYYGQMLGAASLKHFTFHALRHTFASRALEQGMDHKTLSTILGHYSVAFTMDTYAHVLTDHKHSEMALMEELCHIHKFANPSTTYPVVFSHDGERFIFTPPDFPEICCMAPSIEEGVCYVQSALREAVSAMIIPPPPSNPSDVSLAPGQFCLSITL